MSARLRRRLVTADTGPNQKYGERLMRETDESYNTFRELTDHYPPHVAVQKLKAFRVPSDVIAAIVQRHEAEATKILTLKEPPASGRENAQKWYTGPQPHDKNWPAYEKRLLDRLSAEAVTVLHDASDKVVAMLDHPATDTFRSRGLVLGHVQSGKTSNFTAVIGKAADRGYRMFIVLSGVHNALRSQTQNRLISDLVDLNPTLWHQITKPEHDFVPPANAASLLSSKEQKLLLVVKKNGPVLQKLKKWLVDAKEHLANCPTLIIDDEADQATVATKKINPLIADIIGALPKSIYVGYTATPFANLLIDPAADRDFYPKDFILSLPRGVDYQGAEELFGRDPMDGEDPSDVPSGADMIREIPDAEVGQLRPTKGQVDAFEPEMTPSFRRAVLWFWLATAARKARGQMDVHSSMLVHAHSNTKVHDSFKAPLTQLQKEVEASLGTREAALLAELQSIWDDESSRVDPADGTVSVTFDDVMCRLRDVVAETKIVMDHYRSPDRLDYGSGPVTVIAVGGNTLSRGLTLEGLVVSFFVRSADVYDTLLQMSRWFGYRPGYEDLPRIYLPTELRRWFAHLATVEAELRLEIDRLLVEHKTPLQLAARIRCHPQMRVTAQSKMKSAVTAAAAYGGQLVETRYYRTSPKGQALQRHEANAVAVESLVSAAGKRGVRDVQPPGKALWRDVPVDAVEKFIDAYEFDERSTDISKHLMLGYIDRRKRAGALESWNVGVIGNAPSSVGTVGGVLTDLLVEPVTRTRLASSAHDDVADIKTLTGSRDAALDLVVPIDMKVDRSALNRLRMDQQRDRGLVLLYPIDAKSKATKKGRADLDAPGDVIWGVAFVFPEPSAGADSQVEYNYVQANLSNVFPAAVEDDETEAEILSILDEDQDTEVPVAS